MSESSELRCMKNSRYPTSIIFHRELDELVSLSIKYMKMKWLNWIVANINKTIELTKFCVQIDLDRHPNLSLMGIIFKSLNPTIICFSLELHIYKGT